ncbi:MAG: hypothetical protein R3345_02385 [Fulvivirga sp.]|nr:hypothetical protein [Fulvivirga sp.]
MRIIAVLFITCFITDFSCFAQANTTVYDSLKYHAHALGLCVYSPTQDRCAEHDRPEKTEEAYNDEHYYFWINSEWAEQRVQAWMDRQNKPYESGFILFDIRQSCLNNKDCRKPWNGFAIFSLLDTVNISGRQKTESVIAMTIQGSEPQTVLENFHWREFMSGRMGRLPAVISFDVVEARSSVSEASLREHFLNFQTYFHRFSEQIRTRLDD